MTVRVIPILDNTTIGQLAGITIKMINGMNGFTTEKMDWTISNDQYEIIIYKINDINESKVKYSAFIGTGIKYYLIISLEMTKNETDANKYIDVFKACLESLNIEKINNNKY
jgi:hypothetical protein